jgi:uncharacterized protein (TIGR00369 family)
MSMIDPSILAKLQPIIDSQKFIQHLGVEIDKLVAGECEISIAYADEWSQQDGYFHVGIIGTLADNAAGLAAATTMKGDANCLTAEYKLNLLAPAKGDKLIARASVIKSGRTLVVAQTDLYSLNGSQERHVATSLVTLIAV